MPPSLKAFEETPTRRDAKRPYFQFNVNTKLGSGVGTVNSVSSDGSNALPIIAEKAVLAGANNCSMGNFLKMCGIPKTMLLLGVNLLLVPKN